MKTQSKNSWKSRVKLAVALSIFAVLISCRKDVTVELPDYQQKIVVEGSIETGSPAFVFLSYSVPYFGEFDYTTPEKAFIKGATVLVTDGNTIDTLRQLDPNLGYLYVGTKLIGQEGKTYTMRVIVGSEKFSATSTILGNVSLDSLYFEPRNKADLKDSLGYIGQKLREPKGSGDCYRWLSKRLGRDVFYAAPFNSVFDDKFIDGQTFNFVYDRGRQPDPFGNNSVDTERGYYKRGDTVVVKFCKIGRREYDFWTSYYQNRVSNGNPFSSPTNVKSNFDNYERCLGAFVAYSPAFDTIIIPDK